MNGANYRHSCWLWPNHTISKLESGRLREEHNAMANSHDDLLAACEALLHRMTEDGYEDAHYGGEALIVARAAIAKAQL